MLSNFAGTSCAIGYCSLRGTAGVRMAVILPIVLRIGAAAAAGFVLNHLLTRSFAKAYRDQRAEDAFDDLSEGLALSQQAEGEGQQRNATLRVKRSLRIGEQTWDLDAAAMLRLKLSRRE